MGPKYGEFEYPKEFGFTHSTAGGHNPLPHPSSSDDEYGDGTYLAKTEAGPIARRRGGKVKKMVGGGPMMSTGFNPVVSPQGVLGRIAAKGGKRMAKGGSSNPVRDERARKDPTPWIGLDTRIDGPLEHRAYNPLTRSQGELQPGPTPAEDSWSGDSDNDGHAKGGKFIQKGIKRPGRMKNLAKRHGVSTHQEMERDKHSSNPSLRSAANLGLRLTGGDLSPRKKR